MTARGLQYDLNKKTQRDGKTWELKECQDSINEFKAKYPRLTRFLNHCKKTAQETGYIRNLFGRIRWLPNIKSDDWVLRGKDLNASVNTPIQGGSADMMLCGMYEIWKRLDRTRAKMVMTVHDSLVLEVRDDYVVECAKIVKHYLENPTLDGQKLPFLVIPIVSDISIGSTYGGVADIKNWANFVDTTNYPEVKDSKEWQDSVFKK